ncbi:Rieske (2Fe-2S) protein [Natronobiforma cellulositropha]|uniref:Rieske (2Fe-2S) protein n=1 Tax=Natronobiforma cellulositropha TaxID=1679076 RepID=UPI0021D5A99E|nr:Rieske (2Fe-2S) protein [Natronobiforma cellulositropha]
MANRTLIATVADLPDHGDRIIQEVGGVEICVFNIDGEYRAIANYCVHEAGPLCEGSLTGQMCTSDEDEWHWEYERDGELIECPWHSWTFDVKTGDNVKDDRYSVPTYDVDVEDGEIFVLL